MLTLQRMGTFCNVEVERYIFQVEIVSPILQCAPSSFLDKTRSFLGLSERLK